MDVNPRKTPRQTRAKVTVDAIVEATTQLLLKEGYARFTTARVAERAGVSVGTLYQYFPNKAALASAVVDHSCNTFLNAFETALGTGRRERLHDCIKAIVDATLVSHHLAPDLHKIVRELAPQIGVEEKAAQVSHAMAGLIENALREHADEIAGDADLATAAMVIETILEALAHRALTQPAQWESERLPAEAMRLVANYLA
jgi:AcrR family transcriptional regulator